MANGRRGERGGGGSRTKAATQGIPRSLQPLPPLPPPPPERAIYGVGRGRRAAGSATRATLFSLLACVRARQQGWVKITEEGDSQTLWTVSLPLCLSSWISDKRFILVQAFSFTPEVLGRQNYNYPISFEPPFLPPMNNQPWRTRPRYLRQ